MYHSHEYEYTCFIQSDLWTLYARLLSFYFIFLILNKIHNNSKWRGIIHELQKFLLKKIIHYLKIPFSKFNIHTCLCKTVHSFFFTGRRRVVVKCINRSFFLYSPVSVESGPVTAPYSQCQCVDHSNSVDQTD